MCGIASFSGPNMDPVKMRLLMILNEPRGVHGAGCYYPEHTTLQKELGKISESIHKFKIKKTSCFIGHTRHATVGARTVMNQHPFKFDNIIGVHNGSLSNKLELENLYGLTANSVDSQTLIECINKTQSPNVFSDLKGPAAVVFTDTTRSDNPLFVIRNSERPLHRGIIKGEGMYISSEKMPLEMIGCESIQEFKTERLYTIIEGKVTNHVFIKMKDEKKFQARTVGSNQTLTTTTTTNTSTSSVVTTDMITRATRFYVHVLNDSYHTYHKHEKVYAPVKITEFSDNKAKIISSLSKIGEIPCRYLNPTGDYIDLELESWFVTTDYNHFKTLKGPTSSKSYVYFQKGVAFKADSIIRDKDGVPYLAINDLEDRIDLSDFENIEIDEIISKKLKIYDPEIKDVSSFEQYAEKNELEEDDIPDDEYAYIAVEEIAGNIEEIESTFTALDVYISSNELGLTDEQESVLTRKLLDLSSAIDDMKKVLEYEKLSN